jgi:hypothetical protein
MIKSLTVSIESADKDGYMNITGTQNAVDFVKEVVLTVGIHKIAVNSQELAEALATIVDFQTPPTSIVTVETKELGLVHQPMPSGISNLGWTK